MGTENLFKGNKDKYNMFYLILIKHVEGELNSFLLKLKIFQFDNNKENKSPYFGLQNNFPLSKPINNT
jgi:hypothetical protein